MMEKTYYAFLQPLLPDRVPLIAEPIMPQFMEKKTGIANRSGAVFNIDFAVFKARLAAFTTIDDNRAVGRDGAAQVLFDAVNV